MPLDGGVSALFTAEYARFARGVRNLDPDQRQAWEVATRRQQLKPGETPTITLPGWADIVQLGPRFQTTPDERREYWRAARENRQPDLSPEVIGAIDARNAAIEARRTSATPTYLAGFTDILTALDNVQDFTSTIATLGRLVLWAAPRLAGRAVPVLGWVVIASDLLNLLGLLGTLATPAYALLCGGPREALAAGVPGVLFKRALKGQTWRRMLANPFSRTGRAAARLAAAGRLPSFYNLIEVGQTTQALWGYGLSLGGLVGAFFETIFAIERNQRGEPTRINNPLRVPTHADLRAAMGGPLGNVDPRHLQQAAGVLASAAKLQQVQDVLTDEQHMLTLTALAGAIPLLRDAVAGYDWQTDFAAEAAGLWAPVIQDDDATIAYLAAHGGLAARPLAHALPGNPLHIGGDAYIAALAPRVIEETTAYLAARRNTPEALYVGTLINMTCESLYHFLSGDDHAIRWEMATDSRLMASLCEEGYLVNVQDSERDIWRFWQQARHAIEDTGKTRLAPDVWLRLAAANHLTLIKLLPPESPWPPQWDEFRAQGADAAPSTG